MALRLQKDVRELVEFAEHHGFKYVHTTKHLIMKHTNGHTIAIARTPSDTRGLLNKRADIRRVAQLHKGKQK